MVSAKIAGSWHTSSHRSTTASLGWALGGLTVTHRLHDQRPRPRRLWPLTVLTFVIITMSASSIVRSTLSGIAAGVALPLIGSAAEALLADVLSDVLVVGRVSSGLTSLPSVASLQYFGKPERP